MKLLKSTKVVQIGLGLLLLIVGINKLTGFLPAPPLTPQAGDFMTGLAATGYMIPMIAFVEIVCGILILSNNTAAFGTLLLAPLSVNIILFHLFLAPTSIFLAAVVFIANIYLGWRYFFLTTDPYSQSSYQKK